MEEAYCSYEISKLLKEKGFCERCFICYEQGGEVFEGFGNWNKTDIYIAAPTHQMAMAWLRERNIGIIPEIHTTRNPKDSFWSAIIFHLDKSWDIIHYVSAPSKNISEGYDDVIEQAIKYSLEKLI